MATIKFYLSGAGIPAQIYLRVRSGRQFDTKLPTGLFIDPDLWNPKKEMPRKSSDEEKNKELKKIANHLASIHFKINKYINDLAIEGKNLTSSDIKLLVTPNKIQLNDDKDDVNTIDYNVLVNYFNKYIADTEHRAQLGKIAKTTVNKYEVIRGNILDMEKRKRKTYLVKDVNLDFIIAFEEYCKNIQKYSKGTIGRKIKFLKTVCRDARLNGVETHLQLDAIKGYQSKTSFIYLNEDELETLKNLPLEKDTLNRARDWLLLSCYTGQRVSDFLRFTKDMIYTIADESGKTYSVIKFIQKKTGKEMQLPLAKEVLEILRKRNGDFPTYMNDQKYNRLIKEVCKIAGFTQQVKGALINKKTKRKEEGEYPKWMLVSSHIGRRSFASNNYGVLPTPLVMYATGHTTEQMLLKYLQKTDDTKTLELAKLIG